ncbi:hypothetical protein tb265_12220 [Gemmatimonadetes bacterium T265]|nr:hypothetical protein tb265_12220 [Gemmatimonadetes bacterium T265]
MWDAAAGLTGPPPRTLVLLAHPDDEILGASTLLAALGPAAHVVHVTDGAPRAMGDAEHAGCATREAYAALRREECEAALALVGVGAEQQETLGVVDQEAWHDLAGLARQVVELIERLRPALLVTHPYEGGHPDHDATAFAAHAACAVLADRGAAPPVLVEQTSYHADPDPDAPDRLATASFLVVPGAGPVATVTLDDAERARKAEMFAAYASQARVLAQFPIAAERFRRAPAYDFTHPPATTVWYERLGWHVTAADLCAAARGASHTLGLA